MANLTETGRWEAGIYQFETSDPVMGGPNGIDNRPTRELANRTLWLKNELALKAASAVTFTAGAGLTGGGTLGGNRSFALATPSTLNGNTANWAGNGATGHTHELAKATPTLAGVVKLVDTLDSAATDAALSAARGRELNDKILTGIKFARPTVAGGTTAVTLDLTNRESVKAALGDRYIGNGYHQLVLHNNASSTISGLPQGSAYGAVQLNISLMGAFSYIECIYLNSLRIFQTVINWNSETFSLNWRETLNNNTGVMQTGNQTVGGIKTFSAAPVFAAGLKFHGGGKTADAVLGMGSGDIYLSNPVSNKYLQLKDNGELHYGNQKIYHEGNKPAWADVRDKPDIATRGTTLQHYGITDAVNTADFNWAKVPPGTVAYFAAENAPHGWLAANGAAVSRSSFAALFAAIGTRHGAGNGSTTFNLPDLRGEFVRGWDAGRGVDLNRVLGSHQNDEFRQHNHIYRRGHISNAVGWEVLEARRDISAASYDGDGRFDDGGDRVSTAAAGGVETRPRNVALLACIKV